MSDLKKTTVTLPQDLKIEARTKAIREDKSLSAVVRGLLAAWVQGRVQPDPDPIEGDQ